VTDSSFAFAEGTLNVTVAPSIPVASAAVGTSSLWPLNSNLMGERDRQLLAGVAGAGVRQRG
jgi:hypothetical protein